MRRLASPALVLLVFFGCTSTESPSAPAPSRPPAPLPAGTDPKPPEDPPREDAGAAASPDAEVPPPPEKASPGCGATLASGPRTLVVAGESRTALVTAPATYDPNRAHPLVFVFHGAAESGAQARAAFGFDAVAGESALFVYPDATGGAWDLQSADGSNADLALFDALVSDLRATACVDSTRVFATGMSNGAYFTNQLACRRGSASLRAIAPHSGSGPFDSRGPLVCAGAPVPAMILHGLADPTVSPGSGQQSVDYWREADGCASTSTPVVPEPCVAFDGCARPVRACWVPDLGHAVWPGAAAVIWNFFATF